jgi:CheY-like chemotaxis protein
MNDSLRMRILVVDDDPALRMLMRRALEKAGFAVVLAEDGAEALQLFHAQPCDLVMLDVAMPGLDGYQVCSRLRMEVGMELPIMMVTGMDDVESIERAFSAGATDYVAKPINWALIGHRARYLLRAYLVLQDLHAANARNAALLNAIPDILLRVDADGVIQDARNGSQTLDAIIPAQAGTAIVAAAARVRATGTAENLELEFALGDGEHRHYQAHLTPIDRRETLCLISDISARRGNLTTGMPA